VLQEAVLQHDLGRAALQCGQARHNLGQVVGVHQLEQRAAVHLAQGQAQQPGERLVDLPEVPVVAGEGEQLDLGGPGGGGPGHRTRFLA